MNREKTDQMPRGNILVVEDSRHDLLLLTDILEKAGYLVRPAIDGELALQSIEALLPDLVMMDIKLPGKDGIEICRHLKADPGTEDIPIVFISAHDETEWKVKALEAGGADYISKPYNRQEILARINSHLKLYWLQQDQKEMSARLLLEVKEREKTEEQLKASLNEKAILLKEIHHRVKNNMQLLSSLLGIQSWRSNNEEVKHHFQEMKNKISSMSKIHEMLYRSENLKDINFHDYLKLVLENIYQSYIKPTDDISYTINAENIILDMDQAIPCSLIVNELFSNSLKYAFPDKKSGKIIIHFEKEKDNNYTFSVSDNGIGLPDDFDINKTGSMGMTLVKAFVEQLKGELSVSGAKGTNVTIRFPGD